MGISVAIMGASGYAGGELVRLIDGHPSFEVGYLGAHSNAGEALGAVHPHLPGGSRVLEPIDAAAVAHVDAVFLAMPHGASWKIGHDLAEANISVFDLGSDYRMDTPGRYASAYGDAHPLPDELANWAYGLPELAATSLSGASRIAVPGCYPTSALLGLAPLVAAGVVGGPIVIDSVSGVTGAGRSTKADLSFGAIDESVRAYGVGTHRHRPEIEMGLELASGDAFAVQFTPHLVPMQRGILSTCSAAMTGSGSLQDTLVAAYADAPFVGVIDQPPQTRWVVGSNRALIHAVEDTHTGRAIVLVAIDNLLKGAAGQAIQCANLSFGLPETTGLSSAGWLP
jgi:N-acetyl-gamma-glutamyl-phosphate reductase